MTFMEYIRAHGHTTASLAEASGVPKRTLELYTRGEMYVPGRRSLLYAHADTVRKLADALGVDMRELLSPN